MLKLDTKLVTGVDFQFTPEKPACVIITRLVGSDELLDMSREIVHILEQSAAIKKDWEESHPTGIDNGA